MQTNIPAAFYPRHRGWGQNVSISTQLSLKFIMLINVQMPTNFVGIFIFISMLNITTDSLKIEKSLFFNQPGAGRGESISK